MARSFFGLNELLVEPDFTHALGPGLNCPSEGTKLIQLLLVESGIVICASIAVAEVDWEHAVHLHHCGKLRPLG